MPHAPTRDHLVVVGVNEDQENEYRKKKVCTLRLLSYSTYCTAVLHTDCNKRSVL